MSDEINRRLVEQSIYLIRNLKVMLDEDLARLYGTETGALVRAVQRNLERFPQDFMFQSSEQEVSSLRCQLGISKPESWWSKIFTLRVYRAGNLDVVWCTKQSPSYRG
jgi:hypothetical protein